VRKPERKRQLGRPAVDGKAVAECITEIQIIKCYGMADSRWGKIAESCEGCDKPSGSIRNSEILGWVNNWWRIEETWFHGLKE
jgi:hypothetical protein